MCVCSVAPSRRSTPNGWLGEMDGTNEHRGMCIVTLARFARSTARRYGRVAGRLRAASWWCEPGIYVGHHCSDRVIREESRMNIIAPSQSPELGRCGCQTKTINGFALLSDRLSRSPSYCLTIVCGSSVGSDALKGCAGGNVEVWCCNKRCAYWVQCFWYWIQSKRLTCKFLALRLINSDIETGLFYSRIKFASE